MNEIEKNRKEALIRLLIDQNALDADRDDAAMDLGEEFDDKFVLDALIQIASNPNEIGMILSSCGEAIGKIWMKKKFFDEKIYHALCGTARHGIYIVINYTKPEWIEQHRLEKDDFSD